MPFQRFLKRPNAPKPTAAGTSAPTPVQGNANRWRTGLLLLSSAALGGIAVAVWNRRTLVELRNRLEEEPQMDLPDPEPALWPPE